MQSRVEVHAPHNFHAQFEITVVNLPLGTVDGVKRLEAFCKSAGLFHRVLKINR